MTAISNLCKLPVNILGEADTILSACKFSLQLSRHDVAIILLIRNYSLFLFLNVLYLLLCANQVS